MLQSNQIYLGDCLEKIQEIDDNSVDLIIIDPPYLTTKEGWDKIEVVNEELSKHLFRVAKNSCSLYVWCGIGEKSQSLIRWFPIFTQDWFFKDLITWKKQRGIGMRKGWLYTREELMWFVKDNKQFIWNNKEQYSEEKRGKLGFDIIPRNENKRLTNVWTDILENLYSMGKFQKNLLHFTPKPIPALERIIKLHTKENDLVLDCFFGSGSTGVACKNLNRQFIGIEKEEKYFNIAKERLNL
jgi:site-specific DNA-methyltransferase (adenine-specific)